MVFVVETQMDEALDLCTVRGKRVAASCIVDEQHHFARNLEPTSQGQVQSCGLGARVVRRLLDGPQCCGYCQEGVCGLWKQLLPSFFLSTKGRRR